MRYMTKGKLQILLLIFIGISVYLPFILRGGFGSGDDLGFVNQYLSDEDVIHEIKELILHSGNQYLARPVSSMLLVVIHFLFKNNPSLYIATGVATWLLSVGIICIILKNYLENNAIYIFAILASFPIFSTSVFSGPYLFTQYTIPILFWALSLVCLLIYEKGKGFLYYCSGWFLLTLSLLSLSYILPLLLATAFLPIINKLDENNYLKKVDIIVYIAKYAAPVVFIGTIFYTY